MNRKKIFMISVVFFCFLYGELQAENLHEDPSKELYAHPLREISASARVYSRARIMEVIRHSDRKNTGLVKAVITSGKYTREIVFAGLSSYYGGGGINAEEGKNIVISYYDGEAGPEDILVDGYDRTGQLALLLLIFSVVALIAAGRAVVMPFLALAAGLVIIIKFFIPAVSVGCPPVLYALGVAALITVITMVSIGGLSRKTLTAATGALAGLFILGLLTSLFYRLSGITGLHIEHIQMLQYINPAVKFKHPEYFGTIMAAVVILGSSGIIMDVAVSIASSIKEISGVLDPVTFKKLFVSARAVSSEIVSTMTNTLIFAYVGASSFSIFVIWIEARSFFQILNKQFFHILFYQLVLGSMGILVCAGITVFAGACFFSFKKK